jgi:hypothetical protein
MNAAAIDYVWKAIQESERSDKLQFMNAEARWMLPAPSDVMGRETTTIVADPLPMNSDSLPTVTWPPL